VAGAAHLFMIRLFSILSAVWMVSVVCLGADAPRVLCFERGDSVWVALLDGTKPKKVAKGYSADISPDGTAVAFNTDEPSKGAPVRHIAIANIATGKVHVCKGLPSDNCIRPIWSPDGSQLLFQIIADGDWQLAAIKPDGTDFRYVKKADRSGHSFWSACWAPDGKSFYGQDLDSLCQFDLNGTELRKWDLHALFPRAGFSSGARLNVSQDGRTILLDADLDEDVQRNGWDGPPPSVWTLDLETKTTKQLTAKDAFCWEPYWLGSDEYVLTQALGKANATSIFRQKLGGNDRKLVIKDGRNPSVSR